MRKKTYSRGKVFKQIIIKIFIFLVVRSILVGIGLGSFTFDAFFGLTGLQFVVHNAGFDDPLSETNNEVEEPKEETEKSLEEKEKQTAESAEHDHKIQEYLRLREEKINKILAEHETKKFNAIAEEANEKGEMIDSKVLAQKLRFDAQDMKNMHKQAQELYGEGSSKKRSADDAFSGKP